MITNKLKSARAISAIMALIGFMPTSYAANVAIVGNGASSGPYIVSSAGVDIALGTRVRVGKFNDVTLLNNAVSSFKSGTSYSDTLLSLNSNFVDLGTAVTNFGTAGQVGAGVTTNTQFVFNTTANLTVNGTTAAHNVFNGSISNVNYSSSIGFSTPVYIWVAYNDEIGIFRDSGWTTPVSDLTALTLNLNTISNAQTGNTEILLGSYQDYATGTDQLRLQAVPEPSTGVLMMVGAIGLVAMRRLRKA